jgi:hypothetical protein
LSGYDSNPYGGFYVCHYGTPYYVGISSGSYSQQQIITSSSIGSQSVNYASSAGSVTWANVSSKPAATGGATTPVYWNGSGFTNCTSYGDASVNYASYSGYSNKVLGSYTSNGGQ